MNPYALVHNSQPKLNGHQIAWWLGVRVENCASGSASKSRFSASSRAFGTLVLSDQYVHIHNTSVHVQLFICGNVHKLIVAEGTDWSPFFRKASFHAVIDSGP